MRSVAQTPMTDPGRHAAAVAALPDDLDALVAVVQGLLVHVHLAEAEYGVAVTDDDEVHLRRSADVLDRVLARDPAPLAVPRPPERRALGNCRQISVLLTTLLRAHGRPTRARCGFGDYFGTGAFEDHWTCETVVDGRWVRVDAQLDERQRDRFGIDFPITDVPRDRFVDAGDPWVRYRTGQVDPAAYGLSVLVEGGASWIAGNLVRDAASLTGTEVLPWACWGPMADPDAHEDLLDDLARLTHDPDAHGDELDRLVQDDRLRVPDEVYNALRQRTEPVW